jgi:MFS family permease
MVPTTAVHTSNVDLHLKYNLYGWRNCRCGGILSRPLFAYIILCICTFVQNFSVNGANNAVISTLERVFYLNSVQSGLFLALYDLATVFSAPLVGYLGGLYSSPIFFSLNMITVSFGNILIASSNFLNQDNNLIFNSKLTQNLLTTENVLFQCYKDPLNNGSITDVSCLIQKNLSSPSQNAKALLYIGSVVNGIGSVALSTIGIAYIERIFSKEKAAYCQGIYFAVGTVGGALGIVVTGRFLLLYINLTPQQNLPSWLTPSHPLWIGCWWLPYIIYGCLCFLIGLFVSGLPNYEIPVKKRSINRNNTPIPTISAQVHNVPISRENSLAGETTIRSCPPTPATDNILSESCSDLKNQSSINNSTTNGNINHAFSTDTLYNQLPITDSTTTIPQNQPVQQQRAYENWRDILFVICQLMKNVRFIFIVIINLFEGILIKGKFLFF